MKNELNIKKCNKCGKIVNILNGVDTDTLCCDTVMQTLIPNTNEASFEKHIPVVEVLDNKIKVSVNHVMEEKHYIKWIMMKTDSDVVIKYFNPQDKACATFDYVENAYIYSYCNLHDLWMIKVD